MRFREADKIQFVLLALAETSEWITVGPQLAARDILQASDSHPDSKNLRLHGPSQERLVSLVRTELNTKLASRRQRIHRIRVFVDFEALLPEVGRQFRKT